MITSALLMDILEKYPELIKSGLVCKGRDMNICGQHVDLLYEDTYKAKFAVMVKAAPMSEDHLGMAFSWRDEILEGEVPQMSVMLISDRIPQHLQKTLEHNNISCKEISHFQIKEHLKKKNDSGMLSRIGE